MFQTYKKFLSDKVGEENENEFSQSSKKDPRLRDSLFFRAIKNRVI